MLKSKTILSQSTHREGVEEDSKEQDDEEQDDEDDDEPLEAPPQDELECLVGGGEPQEGGLRAPWRTEEGKPTRILRGSVGVCGFQTH